MRIALSLVVGLFFLIPFVPDLPAQRVMTGVVIPPVLDDGNNDNNFKPEVYRAGRGSFRSGRSGYKDTPNPVNRPPAAPTGRFGGFFGGILAGTFLGSLLNPFGFGGYGGGGFSLIGILFWGVIIYFLFRLLRRMLGRSR